MEWSRVMTNNGWRTYPTSLHEAYMRSISSDPSARVPVPTHRVAIDFPGMISANRSYQEIEFDGIEIVIPSTDFDGMYVQLCNAEVEILPGGAEIIKLRGWIDGLVIPASRRKDLKKLMEELLPTARVIGQREDRQFAKAISDINSSSNVKVLSVKAENINRKDVDEDDVPN